MAHETPQMTREQRATQIWSLLVLAARNQQILTYATVGKLVGAPTAALGGWLEPIQSYCLIHELPPLTAIVVKSGSGLPGSGFTGASEVPSAQMRVFEFDWLARRPPSPSELLDAARRLPSNGIVRTEE